MHVYLTFYVIVSRPFAITMYVGRQVAEVGKYYACVHACVRASVSTFKRLGKKILKHYFHTVLQTTTVLLFTEKLFIHEMCEHLLCFASSICH